MPWKVTDVMEQKIHFVTQASGSVWDQPTDWILLAETVPRGGHRGHGMGRVWRRSIGFCNVKVVWSGDIQPAEKNELWQMDPEGAFGVGGVA